MEGYLLLDKPAGWTSFDAVKYVRSTIARRLAVPAKRVKVGHSGTLDPFATGLLIILVGKRFTTKAEGLLKQDKLYELVMKLDAASTTGDPEGEIELVDSPAPMPSIEEIEAALKAMTGEGLQVPPIYSAIKVNGVRAYKLAREQREVKLEPRRVNIKSIHMKNYHYPLIGLAAEVSSGTYIRTLVTDIGSKLGRPAYTVSLRRKTIGKYSVADAVRVESINEQTIEGLLLADL